MYDTKTTDHEWTNAVRELLLRVWLEQACQRSADRPAVQERLLATLGPLVAEAVARLANAFRDGPPADPALTVWRGFPRLDRTHCVELAALLIEARMRHP
jgi:hypothetical protein